jgi:nitrous oxide reductase accessory protein NosL
MNRRALLTAGTVLPALALGLPAAARAEAPAGRIADPDPLDGELAKYPKCPYCGMDRLKWHFSRHLVHYDDESAEGTCSLRCAAVSMVNNIRRVAKAVYAPDNGSGDPVKPLVNAEFATYVIGGDHRSVMTRVPKTPFASRLAAEAARGDGELTDFDGALKLAYAHLVDGMTSARRRREEQLRRKAREEREGG